ncbi:MAG TPA: DUF4845 domain-containing protein [Gallionella sp.]|nr:DUF4845 domain-containing protein [Gallionella sp.]
MDKIMQAKQRGLSFSGFIFGAFVVVLLGIFSLRLVPAYVQNAEIQATFTAIANDPDMQKATPHDIRESFNRRSSVNDIKAIKAEDIDISSDNGKPVLSATYSVKIPVGGNISLYLEFNPSSAK